MRVDDVDCKRKRLSNKKISSTTTGFFILDLVTVLCSDEGFKLALDGWARSPNLTLTFARQTGSPSSICREWIDGWCRQGVIIVEIVA